MLLQEIRVQELCVGEKERDGEEDDNEQGEMERREGGNDILQFILEEPLPHCCDGYQLPRDTGKK